MSDNKKQIEEALDILEKVAKGGTHMCYVAEDYIKKYHHKDDQESLFLKVVRHWDDNGGNLGDVYNELKALEIFKDQKDKVIGLDRLVKESAQHELVPDYLVVSKENAEAIRTDLLGKEPEPDERTKLYAKILELEERERTLEDELRKCKEPEPEPDEKTLEKIADNFDKTTDFFLGKNRREALKDCIRPYLTKPDTRLLDNFFDFWKSLPQALDNYRVAQMMSEKYESIKKDL